MKRLPQELALPLCCVALSNFCHYSCSQLILFSFYRKKS